MENLLQVLGDLLLGLVLRRVSTSHILVHGIRMAHQAFLLSEVILAANSIFGLIVNIAII